MKSILSELHCVTEKQLTNIKTPKTFKECEKKNNKDSKFYL